jgi:hypothetical protein
LTKDCLCWPCCQLPKDCLCCPPNLTFKDYRHWSSGQVTAYCPSCPLSYDCLYLSSNHVTSYCPCCPFCPLSLDSLHLSFSHSISILSLLSILSTRIPYAFLPFIFKGSLCRPSCQLIKDSLCCSSCHCNKVCDGVVHSANKFTMDCLCFPLPYDILPIYFF